MLFQWAQRETAFFFLKRVIASSRAVHVWFSAPWYGLGEPIRKAPLICDGGSEPILETVLRISITLSRIDRANNDHYPTKPHYRLQLASLLKIFSFSVQHPLFCFLQKLFSFKPSLTYSFFLRSFHLSFLSLLVKTVPSTGLKSWYWIQTFIWANSTTLKCPTACEVCSQQSLSLQSRHHCRWILLSFCKGKWQ